MNEKENSRALVLGGLIRRAREFSGQTIADCAALLNLTPDQFEQVEMGSYPISLPELEVLAIFLKVSMGYFWGRETLTQESDPNYSDYMDLRHRVIGVLLRHRRLQARRTLEELAEALGMSVDEIEAYESGETPIPFLLLEQIGNLLDTPVNEFVEDRHGPLVRHEAEQRLKKQFDNMSPDMQQFISNPSNLSFLQTAKRLSEMDVDGLRQIAENILEITY